MYKYSIVTINLNNCIGLEATINSVISQSYRNLQFIIIDGNSSDDSIHVINKYIDHIDSFICETDSGIYEAMNKGIKLISGDYVIFLNSGDLLHNYDTLYNIYILSNSSLFDFIYCDSIETDLDSKSFYKKARNVKYINYGMFTHHQSMIYKTNIILDKKLFYNTNFKISSDWLFTFNFLKYTTSDKYLNIPLSIFKRGGMSSDFLSAMKEDFYIRDKFFKINFYQNVLIFLIIYFRNIFRLFFPFFYNILKFKYIKKI